MKIKRKFLSVVIAAVMLMSSIFALPVNAGAETTSSNASGVKIVFYKPDSWGSDIKIHLWNVGSYNTQWPGVAMTSYGDGTTYVYENTNIDSCNFVINDGSNQTIDLYASGYVGVKDNKVFEKSNERIEVFFKKPADWSNNISMYYYSDDNNEVALTAWPGKAMSVNESRDGYWGTCTGMAKVRVLFTDGVHQYPAAGQPGIPVKAGQELIFDENKYTVNEYKGVDMYQPTTTAYVGEDYHLYYIFTLGTHFFLTFKDENGNIVQPINETHTRRNGKLISDYTFNFSKTGTQNLKAYYHYHSSDGDLNRDAKITVITSPKSLYNNFYAEKNDINLGDTFKVTAEISEKCFYYFVDKDGNEVDYTTYEAYEDGRYRTYYVFKADKLGQYQTLRCGIRSYYSPYYGMLTDNVISYNVWQPV